MLRLLHNFCYVTNMAFECVSIVSKYFVQKFAIWDKPCVKDLSMLFLPPHICFAYKNLTISQPFSAVLKVDSDPQTCHHFTVK